MLKFFRKHKILVLLITVAIIYALQFFLTPFCFPQYYPCSNEATLIFIIPLVLFCVVGNIVSDVNIKMWVIADTLYGIMLCIYNGRGFYGIGLYGVSLDGMYPVYSTQLAVITALILFIVLLAIQMLIRILRLAIFKVKKN